MMNSDKIEISDIRRILNRRFKVESTEFKLRIKDTAFESLPRNPTEESILIRYNECFNEMLKYVQKDLKVGPRDLIGVKFQIPTLESVKPFGLRFIERRELSGEMISDLLMSLQQSNSLFETNSLLEVSVTTIHMDVGGARVTLQRLSLDNYEELCKVKKRSILQIPNEQLFEDQKCLARALIVGRYWIECNQDKKEFNKLFWNNNFKLKKLTDELINYTFKKRSTTAYVQDRSDGGGGGGDDDDDAGATTIDLMKFAKQMPNYQIVVYDDVKLHRKPIFASLKTDKQINLFFLRKQKHFIALSNVKTFFGMPFICKLCSRISSNAKHKCLAKCSSCFQSPPCNSVYDKKNKKKISIQCPQCNRFFRNDICYDNHKVCKLSKNYTVCEQLSICSECFKFIDQVYLKKFNIDEHQCSQRYCDICSKLVEVNHNCFIQPYRKSMPKKFTLVFYDLETVQTKYFPNEKQEDQFEHEAILLCCQKVCELCWIHSEKTYYCSQCEGRETIFEGANCVSEFIQYLLKYKPKGSNNRKIICLAHNGKNFDSLFILNCLLKIPNNNIKICLRGFKLLKIELKGYIEFIDSLSFLPIPLSSFQETFGLDPEISKGFFPYKFLTFENWGYTGSLPGREFFGIENVCKKRQKQFHLWYSEEEKESRAYNLREETIFYCSNDVTVLRHGCLAFMDSIIEIAEINPFIECFTLAQLALLIYRKKFMPVNKLGIVPSDNYHSRTNQSRICRKWLTYLNYFQATTSRDNFFIKPEIKLPGCGLNVDGFCLDYPEDKNKFLNKKGTVFEFNGCFYHGCPKCFETNPNDLHFTNKMDATKDVQRGLYLNQRYQQTKAKLKRLKYLGYNVVHIWEHDFKAFLDKNPKLDKEIDKHDFVNYSNLNARSAIYGGRNEAGVLYYKAKEGEKIRFYDYCSLYSFSMLTSKYFIGEPKRILSHKECDKLTVESLIKMDGIVQCTVLPNQKLFFPVLPYRSKNKLLFPSCRTCAENLSISPCSHSENERSISGVWSLCELKAAFERGYRLIKVFEVWSYNTETGLTKNGSTKESIMYDDLQEIQSKQNENNVDLGFFTAYQKTFIQLKGEASGFPNYCQTDEEKKRYIVDFYHLNDVVLRFECVQNNSTKRSLAKLMLNSLYGKLIQQENRSYTAILRDPSDLTFYLNSDHYEIVDFYCINDNYAVLSWRYKTDEDGNEIRLNPAFERSKQKNICLTTGIQTTTAARLRLYSELEKLGNRCFYMDTDSILFLQKNDEEYCPELSTAVGGLSDELEKHRKLPDFTPYINEFVCIGPKTYAYRIINEPESSSTFKPIIIVRCKGLSLRGENAKKINMELLKSFVLGKNLVDYDEDLFYFEPVQTKRQCIRAVKDFKVVSREETKLFRYTFDKRIVRDNYITYPFGYKQ